jgi:nucleoside-diphosphate-sugar epimerase
LIGSAVVKRFAGPFTVIGFDTKRPQHLPPTADFVEVDLSSDESVGRSLRNVRERHGPQLASVIHLAAYYDFSGEPSPKYEQITVRGTERLLRGLKDFRVEQFMFSSTMLVHRPCEPGQRITEDRPLEPRWDYPKSKVQTEELIRQQHGDIPFALLRIAGVYDDSCHSIPLAHQIQRIYERRLTGHVYPGDPARGQAFIHLDDLIDAFWLLVERRGQLPRELTLLLGEPETLSYEELQRTLGWLIHGEEWETRQVPKALAKTGAWLQEHLPGVEEPFIKPWMIDRADDHYALDITRARTLLGWEPKRSLRDTLPKMVANMKADSAGWYRQNKLGPRPEESAAQAKESGGTAPLIASTTARVPLHTPAVINEQIRRQTEENVARYAAAGPEAIDRRLAELDREWDIERTLEANAATVSLVGSVLGFAVDRRFFVLPALVAGFLLQHALQGWCPPVTFFRRRGFRTAAEIDQERYALKTLRGDFRDLPSRVERGQRVNIAPALEAVRR